MAFQPETAKPLKKLGEALLHASNSLAEADRRLIATYVSPLHACYFCKTTHGADRRRILHVQPLCWPLGHMAATKAALHLERPNQTTHEGYVEMSEKYSGKRLRKLRLFAIAA